MVISLQEVLLRRVFARLVSEMSPMIYQLTSLPLPLLLLSLGLASAQPTTDTGSTEPGLRDGCNGRQQGAQRYKDHDLDYLGGTLQELQEQLHHGTQREERLLEGIDSLRREIMGVVEFVGVAKQRNSEPSQHSCDCSRADGDKSTPRVQTQSAESAKFQETEPIREKRVQPKGPKAARDSKDFA